MAYEVELSLNTSEDTYSINGNVSTFKEDPVPLLEDGELTVPEPESEAESEAESETVQEEDGVLLYPDWSFIYIPYVPNNSSVTNGLDGAA